MIDTRNSQLNSVLLDTNLQQEAVKEIKLASSYQSSFLTQNFSLGYALNQTTAGATATETPNNPVYDKPTETLGVLRQVDKVSETFLLAKRGIEDLREELKKPPLDGAKHLLKRIEEYLMRYATPEEQQELLAGFFKTKDGKTYFELPQQSAIPSPLDKVDVETEVEVEKTEGTSTVIEKVKRIVQVNRGEHSALFATSRVMTDEIRLLETLRRALSVLRRRRQLELAQRQTALADVEEEIPVALKSLATLDAAREEALGDQAVARRLLAEHWSAIEQAWAERARILRNHMGLYYVRVRETPLSTTLPDPLDLRYTDADDIVPGCDSETTAIPADLSPFLAAVYDVPVADWAGLRDLYPLLPERQRIESLVNLRREQLGKRQTLSGGSALFNRLLPLHQETLGLVRDLIQQPFSAGGSLSGVQQQGSKLLALDDLLAGPPHRLRPRAAALHQRLGNAAACLVQGLRAMPPSLRLDWAEAAENDVLHVEQPERWPGLDKAEASDFNAVRTLIELVHWWFRQLHAQASGGARTALRNYLRAALLYAASDDPGQILRGNIATLPGRFQIGERLRITLNREAVPGALLTLLAPDQRMIGTLRVEDSEQGDALAVITQVLDGDTRPADLGLGPNSGWQVLGKVR